MKLYVLSGGAAQAVVTSLAPRLRAEAGFEIEGTFGAVGAMRERLLAGAPADLLVLTSALIDGLVRDGHVLAESVGDLGRVRTGVAVRGSDAAPDVSSPAALREALLAADEVYFPDPALATAGIHVARVIATLGLEGQLAPRLRPHPNGATAMRHLAASVAARPIGITQHTEILNTPGVKLVGPLPGELGLATVYTAAVCTRAVSPGPARRLAAMLVADDTRALRAQAGFDL